MDTKTDTNPPILCVRCKGAGANVYGGGVWSHHFWRDCIEHLTARVEAAEARVAELESQLAAQQWRPIDEPAPEGVIEVKMRCAVADDGGVYKIRTDIFVGWWTSADDSEWRPLPPAPQEPTP